MKTELFIPPDVEEQRNIYEPQGKGVCGVSCLAVILEVPHKIILNEWRNYKGYAPMKDLRAFLVKKGFTCKLKSGRRKRNIALGNASFALARIQWKGIAGGKYHGYDSWQEASMNTHLIVIKEHYFYCNAVGWLNRSKLMNYLEAGNGYITSYFEVNGVTRNSSTQ